MWASNSGVPQELVGSLFLKGDSSGAARRRNPGGNGNAPLDKSFSCTFTMHLDEAPVGEWRLQCMLRCGILGDSSGVRNTGSKYPVLAPVTRNIKGT